MKKLICLALTLALVCCCVSGALAAGNGSFTLVPIEWETAVLGQIGLPAGYGYNRMIYNCDDSTCMGYPLRVKVVAYDSDSNVNMEYFCGEQYLQRVSGYLKHKEGALDSELAMFMRQYVNAAQYCDAKAADYGATFVRDEDMSFFDGQSEKLRQEFLSQIEPGFKGYGMKLDWLDFTAAQRLYTFDGGDAQYAMLVMALDRAYQYTFSGAGFSATCVLWDIPSYYMLTCPMDKYESVRDGAFKAFTDNTTVNDEFQAVNDQLNYQIRDDVIRTMNMQVAASSAYAAAMTALTFSMVESQMSYGSYSSDRFSDYIFDQNDYTLDDNSHVKVSTSYDYVWQSGSTVYYSNSALDVPAGANLLNPN